MEIHPEQRIKLVKLIHMIKYNSLNIIRLRKMYKYVEISNFPYFHMFFFLHSWISVHLKAMSCQALV